MRFNKLLLGAALVVPMMMTSCDPDTNDPITISYEGKNEYSQIVEVPNHYYTFTLPFKLSRELKNGEYMDDVRVKDPSSSSKVSVRETKYDLKGTALNIITTIELKDEWGGSEIPDSGHVIRSYAVNVLKKSGALLKQFNAPTITLNISKKYVNVDYELEDLFETNGFVFEGSETDTLTKDKRKIEIYYHDAKTTATGDVPLTLTLSKNGLIGPTFEINLEKDAEENTKLTVGEISETVWDSDYQNGDNLVLKENQE